MITNKKFPTEEEMEKELQEFKENLQRKYGVGIDMRLGDVGGGSVSPDIIEEEAPEPQKTFDLKFDLKPREIKQYLDRYVINYSLDSFCFFYGHKAGKRVSF